MIIPVRFPIVTGELVSGMKAGLSASSDVYASGVTVAAKMPTAKTARMVIFRDDSGPDELTQSRRRIGVNVYAAERTVGADVVDTDAQNLALLVMAILRGLPDGAPITAVDQLSGPFLIDDDPILTVANKNLNHYYFTGRVSVRGSNPSPAVL